jgi:pimeloyl-ACP methyl ester carboxylesterase
VSSEVRIGPFTGRASGPISGDGSSPLVIAIHGGTYTSRYFDVPGYSLLERAGANGVPAVAIDRYGYGGTPCAPDMSILGQAARLREDLLRVWADHQGACPGVVLIGHSIGAAITLGLAADPGGLPLLGAAVSGIGVRTPGDHAQMWNSLPDLPTVEMPTPIKDQLMFGPPGSFDDAMPAASHIANAPVPKAELVDIVGEWQSRAAAVCARVRVRCTIAKPNRTASGSLIREKSTPSPVGSPIRRAWTPQWFAIRATAWTSTGSLQRFTFSNSGSLCSARWSVRPS